MAKNSKTKSTATPSKSTKTVTEPQEKVTEVTVEEQPAIINEKPKKVETKIFNPPEKKPIEELKFYFGDRKINPLDNSAILRSRFLYQFEPSKYENCHDVTEKTSGKTLGVITRMQLQHAWRMANSIDAKKKCGENAFFITKAEWESELKILTDFVIKNRKAGQEKVPVMFNEVWKMSEIEFETLGLRKPKQVSLLLNTAIIGQMEENRRLLAIWKKIKKYPHKVALEEYAGGIFSESDAKKLRTLKIKYLNDIRDHNVFEIKNLILEKSFENIVKDINTAFKNDLERRRDYRYKFYPFLTAFSNFAVVIAACFYYQYTLIKNSPMTIVIMTLLTLSVLDFFIILIGGKRAKKRVKVVPDYKFYSRGVKWSIAMYFLVCLFTVGSVFLFYQRYDGYDDTLYYRYVDGGIAIAGLRDEDKKSIIIPTEIDGETVVEIEKYSFKGDSITSVIVSDTVTLVDEEAFVDCDELKTITFSQSVTEVGKKAFSSCDSLERIVFDTASDVVLYDNVFENCENVTHLYNFEAVSKIGNEAFYNCVNLQYFDFSDNLTQVGNGAFKNCTKITTLNIPTSLLSVGREAFYYCDGIEELVIPCNGSNQSITDYINFSTPEEKAVSVRFTGSGAIPTNALKDATWVFDVEIGEQVSGVGASAFEGVTNLHAVAIPENVTALPQNAFKGCSTLTDVQGLEHVSELGEYCFAFCTQLENVNLSPTLTSIPVGAFTNTALSQINLPATVTSIGAYAFAGCEQTSTSIDLSNVTTIGDSAFEGAGLIQTVTFSPSLESIGAKAFKSTSIAFPVLPETLTNIGQEAFYDCANLQSITTPLAGTSLNTGTITDIITCDSIDPYSIVVNYVGTNPIQANAFASASFISSIVIGDGVTEIGDGAFSQMSELTSITLPTTVTALPNSAFKGCEHLSQIYGINNVTSIGNEAFMECYQLQSLNVSNATTLGSSVFEDCHNLSSVVLSSELEEIPNKAFYNTIINSITIPSSVKTIGESAFSLTSLSGTISLTNVETIKANAFKDLVDITSIGSLDSLNYLGDSAFEGCENLSSVAITSLTLEYLGDNAFKDCYDLREITTPYIGNSISDTDAGLDDFFYVNSYGVAVAVTQAEVVYPENFASCEGVEYVRFLALREVKPTAFRELNLEQVDFTATLEVIGESAFEGCNNLHTVNGLQNLDSVASKTFKNCSNLQTIDSLANVTSIESYAFSGCSSLSALSAQNVQNIGEYAFEECYSLSNINNFTNLEAIGDYAFLNCTSIGNVYLESLSSVGQYVFEGSSINSIIIPATMQAITEYAFASSSLHEVTVEEGVTTISRYAFADTPLYTVQLPSTVRFIGDYAFRSTEFTSIDLTSLENLNLGAGVFKDNTQLVEANFHINFTVIPNKTFSGCSSLERSNVFNLNVTSVGDEAFYGCSLSSSTVDFNYALSTVGKEAFAYSGLSSLELQNSITSIGSGAFSNCYNLTQVVIPFLGSNADDTTNGYAYLFTGSPVESLTLTNQSIVRKSHFENVGSSLRNVTLTNTSTISEGAFEDCYNITSINLSAVLTTIGKNAFRYCTALTQIEIPSSVREIPEGAFMYCNALNAVNLDTMRVTKIGKNAFAYTALSEIIFAEGLVTVEENAFAGYQNKVIVFSSTMTDVDRNVFGSDPFEIAVAVPTDALLTKYATLFAGLNVTVTKI